MIDTNEIDNAIESLRNKDGKLPRIVVLPYHVFMELRNALLKRGLYHDPYGNIKEFKYGGETIIRYTTDTNYEKQRGIIAYEHTTSIL